MSSINHGASAPESELRADLQRVMKHQEAKRYNDAGAMLDRMIATHGDIPILAHYLGVNAMLLGNTEGGLEQIRKAVSKAPDDPVMICDLGAQLAQLGKLDEAIDHFQMAVYIAPNYGVARSNLGGAQVVTKDYHAAIANLERAIELSPQLLDAHTNLGTAYMQTNQWDKAINVFFKALAIDPYSGHCHTSLSAALYRRERYDTAEYHARRAIELNASFGEPYLHLGNALASSGKVDEAVEVLLSATQRSPMQIMALARLIHIRRTVSDAPELTLLEASLDRSENMGDEAKATLYYAAGKAFDDLGDYENAFRYFQQANEISNKLYPFEAKEFEEREQRLREYSAPARISNDTGTGVQHAEPIFICGMPRSGTTLMEQMLSRHPKIQAGGEMHASMTAFRQNARIRAILEEKLPEEEVAADDFNRLGEDYLAVVRGEGIRSSIFTDKMPANHRYIGILAVALPKAKFLIMRRHPLDCLLSNYFQSFGRNQPFSSDFENLAIYFAQFHKSAEHWSGRFPDRVRQVAYENIVNDSEAQLRSVVDFVGLEWTPDVLDHRASTHQVSTASIGQVREPIYTRAVARWEHYRDEVSPLLDMLKARVPDIEI